MAIKIPSRLYKYKNFSVHSLDLLVSDKLYFADPTTFNDPLDCNPSLLNNIESAEDLNVILHKLVKDNHQKELEKAAKKIKYKGQRILERIELLGEIEAQNLIDNIAQNVDFFGDDFIDSTVRNIKYFLLKNYDVGVLSLAKKFNCPLMWSHYADQHKGFCIGYEVSLNDYSNIYPVDYKGNRFIKTQQIYDMLFGSSENLRDVVKKEIDRVILLSKAPSWKYEQEYRVIDEKGLQDSEFRLSDVTFGLRFNESAMFSVLRALQSRQGDVKFYKMSISNESFKLKRELIDLKSFEFRFYPASNYERNLDVHEMFDDVSFD